MLFFIALHRKWRLMRSDPFAHRFHLFLSPSILQSLVTRQNRDDNEKKIFPHTGGNNTNKMGQSKVEQKSTAKIQWDWWRFRGGHRAIFTDGDCAICAETGRKKMGSASYSLFTLWFSSKLEFSLFFFFTSLFVFLLSHFTATKISVEVRRTAVERRNAKQPQHAYHFWL